MRKIYLFLALLIINQGVQCQNYINKKGDVHLWGKTDISSLKAAPYDKWYEEFSKDFESSLTEKDGKLFDQTTVKVFIGTWCGDTKYLLPKFIEAWQQMGLPEDKLEIIALHNEGDHYKQGPKGETLDYGIHRVPTFIFEKGGKEIGRIVENTVHDIDIDMMLIANGQPYKHRYQGATLMQEFLEETPIDSLQKDKAIYDVFKKVRRSLSKSSELNALGYVLKAQGKLKEAEFVLKTNRYIYRHDPNIRDSYGEILFALGKNIEAMNEYYEVIRLSNRNENAVKQLAKIYAELEKAKESED